MIRLVLVVGLLSISRGSQPPQNDLQAKFATPCVTPNHDQGVCIEVQKCKVFIEAIASGRNDSHEFIKNSRCGPINEDLLQPKVCCGQYDNYISQTTYNITTSSSTSTPTKAKKTKQRKSPFPAICGNSTILLGTRIYGGTIASLGEFPWMARLRHRRKDALLQYGCAGFLIAEKFVLTAAHCIRSKSLSALGPIYQVQLGEHDTATDPDCDVTSTVCANRPQYVRVAKPIVHPEYTDNMQHHNDIAIIPLKTAAIFTDSVYPICLSTQLSQESEMWLSGWGRTEIRESSSVKLKVSVPRADFNDCKRIYGPVGVKLLKSQFCAGGNAGKDSCTGDSGAPIMVQQGSKPWHAEGIVSFGMGCGLEGWPGIYTSIPEYMDWIKRTANRYLRKHDNQKSNKKKKI